jgi:hypothetical protein
VRLREKREDMVEGGAAKVKKATGKKAAAKA